MTGPVHKDPEDGAASGDGDTGGVIGVFIRRPILAAVVSLLIVLAGLAAMNAIEVRELPEVDQPVISITTNYPGASPESMDAEVTSVLESAVAQVDGVMSISSSSTFARSSINVEFTNSTNIDIAATDMKNALSATARNLPDDVEEPQVRKADSDASPIMRLYISANGMDPGDLADLVDDVVLPRLQSVEGVAQANDYGVKNRVIRVRIVPVSLASRGFTVADVNRLLATAGANAPSGRLRNSTQQILIRADAQATTPEAIAALRLDADTRLADVAIVEWGFEDESTTARVNGSPGIGVGIIRQAQSNTVAVSEGVRAAVDDLKEVLPTNVDIRISMDDSIFINAAIQEVFKSLFMATAIVVLVIFVFLRSLRATIIPAVTIPVSLLGTVAALWLAGFSINLITLLALVMATGLVVDDAIVVTENIQRWRFKGAGKRAAAVIGAREIVFAVLSTTATLAAVFIPISFLPGQAGRLFSEFGFVLAFAVMVSSFIALTLCPVLTVRFGREVRKAATEDPTLPAHKRKPAGPLSAAYAKILRLCLRVPIAPAAASLAFAAGAFIVFQTVPKELTPQEDRGVIFSIVAVQEGASFQYLDRRVLEMEAQLQTLLDAGEATDVMSINGVLGRTRSFLILRLNDWAERDKSQADYQREFRALVGGIPGATAIVRRGNSLGIRGAGQGLQFAVMGDDYGEAADAAQAIADVLSESDTFSDVRLDFNTSQPQITIDVDRDAASQLGVPIPDITTAIQAMADEVRAAEIFVGDNIIDVLVSGAGKPVNDPTDLENIFVRTGDGSIVPMSSVATVREEAVASNLRREQRRRAVPVTASLTDGARLGDAVVEMREVASEVLAGSLSVALLGEARLLDDSSNATLMVFGFAGLIVFLVLAAQFESFISALIIMVTVPFGLAAAFYAIQLTGGSINYYSQIGLVLLIGIMAKNGILIVEFANKLRDQGESVSEAIEHASITRLRPVLMTAISTLLGGAPLILGSGAGAEARAALGWVVVGGLGFATLFTLFLTPVAYKLLAGLSRPRAAEGQLVEAELAEMSAAKSSPAE
ncbi:MAG: efflux RND transporter permease subunit [Pseudomonadota bacterium]